MLYPTTLTERHEEAEGILSVRLEKPEGFRFHPGQWCFLNLPDLGLQDARGLRRHLSLASSPADGHLLFATKLSPSAFKQTLARLEPGAGISLEEPRGRLALPEDPARPLAFLAGGIGITPFRSMLRHAAQARSGHRITLFYSNRKPEEAPFLDELLGMAREGEGIDVVATMTRMNESSRSWDGPTGRLNPEMIRAGLPEWESALYFLAGPPPMVEAMQGTLAEMGIAGDQVRPELFSGY